MIPVTKTYLPAIERYHEKVNEIWHSGILTNRGSLVVELEASLKKDLNQDHLLCTSNGTIPLQIALKLYGKKGEIITTPFSYVATTAAIQWEGCKPVFVDIERDYWTIDPQKIIKAITPKTTCILATHVFGNPCDIESIEKIAKDYNLRVIYDAAHCFGVNYNGKSIFSFGDISTCSFHATKIFHTAEGGAIFCNNPEDNDEVFGLHNFGHKGKLEYSGLGINAKMSELSAAMGLAVLPDMKLIFNKRKNLVDKYKTHLSNLNCISFKTRPKTEINNSYFPLEFPNQAVREKVEKALNAENIIPRRYFFPSLNKLPYIKSEKMPISESLADRVLCLPLYHSLSDSEQMLVINIIKKTLS